MTLCMLGYTQFWPEFHIWISPLSNNTAFFIQQALDMLEMSQYEYPIIIPTVFPRFVYLFKT